MKSITLYQLYKKNTNNLSFFDWVTVKYPQINIKGMHNLFLQDWLNGNSNIMSNNSFILWICKNYYTIRDWDEI